MAIFEFDQPPLLSRSTVPRADEIRDDPDRQRSGWPTARVLCIDARGQFPVLDDGALRWTPATEIADEPPADAAFLGISGTDLWTIRVESLTEQTSDPRRGAARLSADEAGLLATALGILNWHASAQLSPVDGNALQPARGGWVRRDPTTGRDEFPRTDPAIITVVHDGADRILLGRQAVWPDRWYSTLAGFVEPGESLEQCVIREVHEEVGITVTDPRYLGSQPWPFPRSLMLGFEAVGDPSDELRFLDGEIGDAQWFHRDEVLEALDRGTEWIRDDPNPPDGPDAPRLLLPGSISIAHALITTWARAGA